MKTVLLTGSSRGIGKAIYATLKDKYKIIAPGRSELDLLDDASIDNFISKYKDKPIDIIINDAGVGYPSNLEDIRDEIINQTIKVNLVAPLKLIRGLTSHMKKKRYGRIINISSIAGMVGREKRIVYSMTKFGLNGLTISLSLELGKYNILVNSVCPGFVDTALTKKNVPAEEKQKLISAIPLGRFADPSEIASTVEFLISEKNTYITGHFLVIDGGFICQ